MSDDTELDPAVGELLSAMLDGQLDDDERATAEAWLARSDVARREYAELARVRDTLRSLPAVDPPFGFYERMLRSGAPDPARGSPWRARRSLLLGGAGLTAAAAAVAVVALATGGDGGPVLPPITETAAAVTGDTGLDESTGDPTVDGLDGFAVEALLRSTDSDVAVTRLIDDDGDEVAVARSATPVAWEDLPEGRRSEIDGFTVWVDLSTDGALVRIVVAQDDDAWTLASQDLDEDELIDLATSSLDDQP